ATGDERSSSPVTRSSPAGRARPGRRRTSPRSWTTSRSGSSASSPMTPWSCPDTVTRRLWVRNVRNSTSGANAAGEPSAREDGDAPGRPRDGEETCDDDAEVPHRPDRPLPAGIGQLLVAETGVAVEHGVDGRVRTLDEAAHVVHVRRPRLPWARERPGGELLRVSAHGQAEVRFEAVDEVPGDGHGLQRIDEDELAAVELDPRESVEREDQGADSSGDACGGEAARWDVAEEDRDDADRAQTGDDAQQDRRTRRPHDRRLETA